MKTTSPKVFLALVLVVIWSSSLWSYHVFGRYNTAATPNTYIPVRYDVTKLPNSTITFYLNDQPPTALASGDTLETFISQVTLATATWNSVSTSSLRVNFGGYTKLTTDSTPSNPVGVLRFSSSIPPGAVAVGGPVFQVVSGTPDFFPITLSTVFLPTNSSGTSTSAPSFLPTLVHEMGHSLGAKHSLVAAVMYQTGLTGRARMLTEDDLAMISSLYPTAAFNSSTGTISGRVTTGGQGVSVAAVAAFSDTAVIGALTNPDGIFTIRGLSPGAYRLMVQPLMKGAAPASNADNAGDPADMIDSRTLSDAVVTINTNIDSAFFGAGGAATKDPNAAATFTVTAGQTTSNANVSVGSRAATRMEVNTTFTFFSSGNRTSTQLWALRGTQAPAGAVGTGLGDAGLSITFTGSDLATVPGSSQVVSGSGVFTTQLNFSVQVGAGAALGPRSVIYRTASDTYFSPGQVRVVASGPPQISSISPTSGPAGTSVAITGSNFDAAAAVFFDGMPATVTSRSSTQLVAQAPQGAGGRAAAVFVNNPDGQSSDFLANPPTFTFDTAATPSVALSPATGRVGKTQSITITGTNTHFQQAVTLVGFGSGDVYATSVTVNSATSLVANVAVASTIDSRSFPVTVVTGQEVVYSQNAFTIPPEGPFTLKDVSGQGQTAAPGSALANPLVVRATDGTGAAVSGVTVTFRVTFGGGSVSPASAVTDSSGQASARLTLGSAAGLNIVTATADQYTSIAFLAGGGGSSALTYVYSQGGDKQTGPAGSALPTKLSATFFDNAQNRNPLSGLPVTWAVTAGGGTISPSVALTDSTGKAEATWTLGTTVGAQTAAITVGTALVSFPPIPFTATATTATGPQPSVPSNGILNGAGFDSAPALSAGAIASIFGINMSTLAAGELPGLATANSLFTTYKGTKVTFDGVGGPLFFVSAGQLNVQVPFETSGKASSQVVVTLNGVASSPVTVSIVTASPALFTANSSGKGPVAALNQDFSAHTAANGEARGRVIQLFGTGLGATNPAGITGQLAPSSPPLALCTVNPTVTIGGQASDVQFCGLAPGFVGLWQVNVLVPAGAATGEQPLVLRTGTQNANAVTVFVK